LIIEEIDEKISDNFESLQQHGFYSLNDRLDSGTLECSVNVNGLIPTFGCILIFFVDLSETLCPSLQGSDYYPVQIIIAS